MLGEDVAFLLGDAPDFGSALTLTRPGTQIYNSATGTTAPSGGGTFTVRGVFINYSDERIDGSVIRTGDRMLLVAVQGSTTAPANDDVVDGMRVVSVRSFAPNGVPIAFSCQMR